MTDGAPFPKPLSSRLPSVNPADLNFAEGLERCMRDEGFYASLLTEFRQSFASAPDRIENLMNAGDWKAAESLTHSLKGTSGMLSATSVFTSSTILDRDLKVARDTGVPPPSARPNLALLKKAMAGLVQALDTLNIRSSP